METRSIDYERPAPALGVSADTIHVAKDAMTLRLLIKSHPHFSDLFLKPAPPPERPRFLVEPHSDTRCPIEARHAEPVKVGEVVGA